MFGDNFHYMSCFVRFWIADVEMVFSRMLPITNFTVEIEKFLVLAE